MAGEAVDESWPVEHIPDSDSVFFCVHKQFFDSDNVTIKPGAFQDKEGGMSVDWDKYSSPVQSQQRRKVPLDNAVVRLSVEAIRSIENQSVLHEPLPLNRAHAEVIGKKNPEVRVMLQRAAVVVLARARA